jgi:hypothetical protein
VISVPDTVTESATTEGPVRRSGCRISPPGRNREEARQRAFEIHIERGRIHRSDLDVFGCMPNGSSKILRAISETQSEKSLEHDNSELQND